MSVHRWSTPPLRRLFACLAAALVLLAAAGTPMPAAADVYTVERVPVDVTADSAAQARERALAQGQRGAFDRLMARMLPQPAQDQVPEVPHDRLTNMVRDFEVFDERTSAVRYLAELTVRFRPEAVRRFLQDNAVAYAETVSRPVVVLPVFDREGTTVLWDRPNPWFDAWARRTAPEGLVPLEVPLGDLGDLQTISATAAVQGEQEPLEDMAARYDAGDVLVTQLMLRGDAAAGSATAQVVSTRVGLSGPRRTLVETLRQRDGEDLDALLARAGDTVVGDLEEAWKQANLMRLEDARDAMVRVPLRSLDDWTRVRQRLARVPVVGEVELRRFSRGEAELAIVYYGDSEQLRLALAQSNLLLEDAPEGVDGADGIEKAFIVRAAEGRVHRPAVPTGVGDSGANAAGESDAADEPDGADPTAAVETAP